MTKDKETGRYTERYREIKRQRYSEENRQRRKKRKGQILGEENI